MQQPTLWKILINGSAESSLWKYPNHIKKGEKTKHLHSVQLCRINLVRGLKVVLAQAMQYIYSHRIRSRWHFGQTRRSVWLWLYYMTREWHMFKFQGRTSSYRRDEKILCVDGRGYQILTRGSSRYAKVPMISAEFIEDPSPLSR